MNKPSVIFLFALIFLLTPLFSKNNSPQVSCSRLNVSDFTKTINGKQVGLYYLRNGQLEAAITNYGGRIVSLCTPSKTGEMADVVLGFKSIDDYLNATGVFHGAIVGRVAGRISKGCFDLNGTTYNLPINSLPNHIHGGINGFHNQVWEVGTVTDTSIVLTYLSVDGEMGYPGNLKVKATYILNSKNEFSLEFSAITDKSTPVNLTNHAFFNLGGEGNGTILNHLLTINAKNMTPINTNKIPTGELVSVNGTPFDFRIVKPIGQQLVNEKLNEQLKIAEGFDHNFVLNKKKTNAMNVAATVIEPVSGRKLEVITTQPCLQFFSANFFKGLDIGKMGIPFNYRESFALETQAFPDAPNQKNFPSIILQPNTSYYSKTIYRLSVVK